MSASHSGLALRLEMDPSTHSARLARVMATFMRLQRAGGRAGGESAKH
jgi:hypothetical protein